MEISVIIPAYNEEKLIESCLKSITRQEYPRKNYEVIVVDGNSTDKTVSIAKKHADKVITQKFRKGPGLARNKGVKESKGRLLVFLDADTTVQKNFLKEVMKNEKGVIGGMPIIKTKSESKLIRTYHDIITNKVNQLVNKLKLKRLVVPCTACCFYKKKVFEEVSGFREFTWDDVDLWYRAKKKGKFTLLKNTKAVTSDRKYLILFKKLGKIRTLLFYIFVPIYETIRFNKNKKESKYMKRINYFKRE